MLVMASGIRPPAVELVAILGESPNSQLPFHAFCVVCVRRGDLQPFYTPRLLRVGRVIVVALRLLYAFDARVLATHVSFSLGSLDRNRNDEERAKLVYRSVGVGLGLAGEYEECEIAVCDDGE
jgi:hypothetical protein